MAKKTSVDSWSNPISILKNKKSIDKTVTSFGFYPRHLNNCLINVYDKDSKIKEVNPFLFKKTTYKF